MSLDGSSNRRSTAVFLEEPSGVVTRLFPNESEPDDRLKAGQERVLPGDLGYTVELTPTEGAGVDRLRVIATTGELFVIPKGVKVGRFETYSTELDRERLATAIPVRGIVLKKDKPDTAEVELKLLIKK